VIFTFNVEFFSTFHEKHTVFLTHWHTIGHFTNNNCYHHHNRRSSFSWISSMQDTPIMT